MATSDDITRREPPRRTHKPIRREEFHWGVIYSGTRDQLVGAGIIGDDSLPDRGTVRFERDGRKVRVDRTSKHRFSVWLEWTEAEAQARAARVAFERDLQAVDEQIGRLPSSHDEYRAWVERLLEATKPDFLLMTRGGYSFDAETVERVELLASALRQAVTEGRTQFSRAARNEEIEALRDFARRNNPDFARFLGRLKGED